MGQVYPVRLGVSPVPLATNKGGPAIPIGLVHKIPFEIGGHPNLIVQEFSFTTAQTDAALVSVSAGSQIVVTLIDALLSNATTVNVACRVGFATATLPATSGSGASKIILSHPKFAPGAGMVKGNGGGVVGIGADGEDLRITCGAATGGELRVTVHYFIIESTT